MDVILVYESNAIEAINVDGHTSVFRESCLGRVLAHLRRIEANIVQIVYPPVHPPKGAFVRQSRR